MGSLFNEVFLIVRNSLNLKKYWNCYGMETNVEKTKVMRISRQPSPVTIMIDQNQLENVECFKYLGSMLTNDRRCTREIKSRIAMAKAAFSKKTTLFTSKLDLNLRKKLIKCYIWSMALYGAETWTLRAADQKYLESYGHITIIYIVDQRNAENGEGYIQCVWHCEMI